MKIFVDENIPFITVKQLRSKGFDVKDIRGSQEFLLGCPKMDEDFKIERQKDYPRNIEL